MYEAVYQRALINQKLGNHTSTISDMSKVIEHYPNFAPAYYARANSYNVLQNKNGAYRDMQAIIRIEEANKKRGNNQSNKTEDEIDTNAKTTQNQSKISDWAKLFEMSETEESTENRFKDNTIRGAIQNRFVEAKPQSDFVLSPYKKDKDVASNNYFFAPLNNLNRELKNELTLYMVNIEVPLTDALINYLFRNIDVVSGKIARDPNDFYSYFVRAIHYSLVQDFDNAIKDFSSAIQLKNDALAYFCRAELRKKQLEVSVANIKTEEDKNKATSLAIDKMLSVDYEMVLRDYDKAIELSAEFVFAHYNRANILIQLKDYNAAIAYYTNAIRINTNFAEAYFNRGLTYIYLRDTDRGIADLSKAGELGIYDAYNLIKKVTN